jgi:hypothetical protein
VNGFPLNASEMNTFLMNQTVSTFADSAARTAAIATPAEGQITYLNSDNKYYKYDGAGWVEILGMSDGAIAQSPNYIINGAFDIWQRGTSFSNPASGTYTADRFLVSQNGSGATRTISRLALTAGDIESIGFGSPVFGLRYDQSVAGSGATFNFIRQRIEGVSTLSGQTVSLSFWAKASSSATLESPVFQQEFGSGGSSATFTAFSSFSLTTSWQRFTMQATIPSVAGKTLGAVNFVDLYWRLPLNTTFTIDIWGVQLEAGSVATPFRRNANSIQGELAACQRYYWRFSSGSAFPYALGQALSTTNANLRIEHPTTMRTAPTFTFSAAATWSVTGATGSRTNLTAISASLLGVDFSLLSATTASGLVAGNATYLINAAGQSPIVEMSAEL